MKVFAPCLNSLLEYAAYQDLDNNATKIDGRGMSFRGIVNTTKEELSNYLVNQKHLKVTVYSKISAMVSMPPSGYFFRIGLHSPGNNSLFLMLFFWSRESCLYLFQLKLSTKLET
ncbi:hypothetical protein [Aquimarina algiphila]|uniref:hypothetical protein n=1 Tax=Aquimarina algiphila TaxID=2047982 RepID=UPI00248FE8F8|nr:hypothetical protein [Aquimarina algiphila]